MVPLPLYPCLHEHWYLLMFSPLFGLNRQWAFLSHSCSLVHGLVHCFLEVAPMFPTIPTSSVLVLAWH